MASSMNVQFGKLRAQKMYQNVKQKATNCNKRYIETASMPKIFLIYSLNQFKF